MPWFSFHEHKISKTLAPPCVYCSRGPSPALCISARLRLNHSQHIRNGSNPPPISRSVLQNWDVVQKIDQQQCRTPAKPKQQQTDPR
mmetsp:Transcript_43511/g.68128  ORF Transcript_43511/g.68128 Transcript_43511/m.68128 type:complete len:87 (-) Transcript_43511:70-330(-)